MVPGLVSIPCLEWIYTRSVESLLRLRIPPGSACCVIDSTMPVPAKRNELVDRLLSNGGLAWLLMLDSDMTPEPDIIERLWELDADIASPLYFQRVAPHECVCGTLQEGNQFSFADLDDMDGPLQCDWVGAGCMLVRRHVFERMRFPWFYYDAGMRQSIFAEDMVFCRDAGRAGFRIVVDPSIVVGHVSARAVTGDDYRIYHRPVDAGVPEQEQ